MGKARSRGFTLIELALVLALVGILAALSIGTLSAMRPRATAGGAANELTAALSEAQARAMSTGGYVWFIAFESSGTSNVRDQGGYLVYDDPDGDLDLGTFTVDDDGDYSSPESGDRIVGEVWFARGPYDGKVRMAAAGTFDLGAPFTGQNDDCNFCTASAAGGERGALRFDANGELTMFDGSAARYTERPWATLTLASGEVQTAISIAPQTGLVRVTKP